MARERIITKKDENDIRLQYDSGSDGYEVESVIRMATDGTLKIQEQGGSETDLKGQKGQKGTTGDKGQ